MFIITEIIPGALSVLPCQSASHFTIIKTFIKPKSTQRRIIWGINSKKNSTVLPKYKELNAFIRIPRDICATPNITAIFILKLFVNVRTFEDRNHAGSIPMGSTQSSLRETSCIGPWSEILNHVSTQTGIDMKSLYQTPLKIEKKPMSTIMYLASTRLPIIESLSFLSKSQNKMPAMKRRKP
mmetsp:Transcript_39935/g.39506  ORF Transcript_39935/g.39506 Transcript_39935/m.39506 type:complete len:182 (-) Transcript_39935:16-561(-)